jgi:predicted ATPase
MKLVLSGFAGVGKSTVIDYVRENHPHVFISPESAREVNYTKDFFSINDPDFEFFQKSVMDNELMKIMLTHLNAIPNVIYDRSLIDNLAFAEIFYGKERINYKKVQEFINKVLEDYNVESIYDTILFIKSTKNTDFVNKFILNDPFRRATTAENAEDFIKKSNYWEGLYFEILEKLTGISNSVITLEHFSETEDYESELDKIFEYHFNNKTS